MAVEKPDLSYRGRGETGRPDGGFFVHSVATGNVRYKGIEFRVESAEANAAGLLRDSVANMEGWISAPHIHAKKPCMPGGGLLPSFCEIRRISKTTTLGLPGVLRLNPHLRSRSCCTIIPFNPASAGGLEPYQGYPGSRNTFCEGDSFHCQKEIG